MPEAGDIQGGWRQAVHDYAREVNAYIAEGERVGWADMGPEPGFPALDGAAEAVLDAVREANRLGQLDDLKDRWPPAHAPLARLLRENGQLIPAVAVLDDGSILARVGVGPAARVVRIVGDEVAEVPGADHFGRCPARRFFAVATPDGVRVTDGWAGALVTVLPWPTGQEGVPRDIAGPPATRPTEPRMLVPFPDGSRVLLVSEDGVFVLTADGARRLLPTEEAIREMAEDRRRDDPGRRVTVRVDMPHGAISADGSLIAVGIQNSQHMVFDAELNLVARFGPLSSYPHFAVFSHDQGLLAVNSCHFYNGVTVGVPTRLLPGLTIEPYRKDDRLVRLEGGARVYAAAARGDELLLGEARGHVFGVGLDGVRRWEQFIGSTVTAMDISADGRTLVVATYAGWISILDLDAGEQQPYQIGTGGHRERRRWLFWRNEPAPLVW